MNPMVQGAHAYGTLLFQTSWPLEEIGLKERKLRLTFQDAARRTLSVVNDLRGSRERDDLTARRFSEIAGRHLCGPD